MRVAQPRYARVMTLPRSARSPFALALPFTLGILAVHALRELPAPWMLGLFAIPALLPWRGRATHALFVFGVLWCVWRVQDDVALRWPLSRHNETIELRGHVAALPEPDDIDGERRWRFQFRADDASIPLIRASWYRAPVELKAGECWLLTLRMRTPHGSMNPGAFDYEAWLFREGVGALASVRSGERCEALSGPPWLLMRQRLLDRLHAALPGHPGLPLLAALTIGDDSAISAHDWDVFRQTGTTHLVAISGFNVAIGASVAFFLGRWLWALWPPLCLRLPAQKAGMVAAAVAGVAYAFLAGWEPPVQRAALMLVFLLGAAWFDRLQHPFRVLALAWIAVLLVNPEAVLSPGLWLSFGAVGLIFYLTLHRLAAAPFWVEALRVQAALTLGLLPLSLGWFHGMGWSALPVNLIAVPLVAVITPIALAGLLLDWIWPWLGTPLLGLTASALSELQRYLQALASWTEAGWWAASPPLPALALALLGALLLLAPRGLPTRPLGLLCLLPLLWPPQPAPARGFEVTMLDVGQGLSVVVQTADHTLLYDAGPAVDDGFDAGESVVVPYLLGRGIRQLDAIVISHEDRDHAGGLSAVRRYLGAKAEYGALTAQPCRDGQAWNWDGVEFRMLHPDEGQWSDNEGSCVLLVIDGTHRLLLAGDIERRAERRLIDLHAQEMAADLLVAPHHGSKSSSSQAFVDAVRPKMVLYGAGWRSRFGHPRPEVVARYSAIGAEQRVTGVAGALFARPATDGWAVEGYREQALRWWNAPAEP